MPEKSNHRLIQRTFIDAPPEKVFDTITSADEWNRFFLTGCELEPKVGGKFIFRWKDWGPDFYTTECPGEILEFERPNKFVFAWGTDMVSRVEFDLKEEFGGTTVTCTEQGYPDDDKGIKALLSCACGWGEAVTLLKFYMEHGVIYTQPKK